MKLTVCSLPVPILDEHKLVQELLQSGLSCFHLRKPTFSKEEMTEWLALLPEEEQKAIVLHSHWSLADQFSLKGLHLGASVIKDMSIEEQQSWISYAKKKQLTVSSSAHHQEEI